MFSLDVSPEALDTFKKFKMKSAYRWIIFKIENKEKIIVEQTGEPTSNFAEFASKLPKSEPRYAVYEMHVEQKDGCKMNKLLFFLYAPDSADSKDKFVYASGKSAFKSKIGAVHKEFQVFLTVK